MKNVPRIKLERISEAVPLDNEVSANKIRDSLKENIKIEKPDMPPPQMPLKKNKKTKKESSISSQRTTRSTVTKGNQESTGSRDSDIVLQKPVIETFTLSDSDDENERIKTKNQTNQSSNSKSNAADVPSTRTTRTKTRAKNQTSEEENPKRSRSPSTDVEKKSKPSQSERKTKRKKSEESPPKEQSVYEDAESTVSNNTEVTSSDIFNESPENKATQRVVANETVVINTPKVLKPPMNMEDIMTDDEDDNITVTVPKKVTKVIGNSTKAIFSPFEGSPVKKRVEAFERLGAEISTEIPVRTTRTKTKALKERNVSTFNFFLMGF